MKNKGFSLIEMVVAVFVILVGVVTTFGVLQKIIVSTSISSSRLVATYLAQEGIEVVRNVRDTNWVESKNWTQDIGGGGGGLETDYDDETVKSPWIGEGSFLEINNEGFYSYDSGVETKFKRKIIINETPSEKLEVKVEVFWKEHGRDYRIVVQEDLYNWWRD